MKFEHIYMSIESIPLPVRFEQEGDDWICFCDTFELQSYGKTKKEAKRRIVDLYIELVNDLLVEYHEAVIEKNN